MSDYSTDRTALPVPQNTRHSCSIFALDSILDKFLQIVIMRLVTYLVRTSLGTHLPAIHRNCASVSQEQQ